MVYIGICSMINSIECLYLHSIFLDHCISSLEKCLFKPWAQIWIGLSLLFSLGSSQHIHDMNALLNMGFMNSLSHFMFCLLSIVLFLGSKILNFCEFLCAFLLLPYFQHHIEGSVVRSRVSCFLLEIFKFHILYLAL